MRRRRSHRWLLCTAWLLALFALGGCVPTARQAPPAASPLPATPTATPPRPATPSPAPTATLAPSPTATPSPLPTATPTPTPLPRGTLDLRVWNDLAGLAEVHVDGASTAPGLVALEPGTHRVALLVDGAVHSDDEVEIRPGEATRVDLTVPPPLAPLAVVVENSPNARPHSGLHRADVVYEALAEGGIPRFLAVYLSGDTSPVGPVRSLRHYFAFMAAEYGADLVHIGASPQGFAWRDALRLGKLDESAGDPGVWRSRARFAPHNAYTDTAADRVFLAARGRQQGSGWGPLRMQAGYQPVGEPAEQVVVTFSPSPYRVSYTWDADSGRYRRFMQGAPHRDAETGEQVSATTVAVQFTQVDLIPGDPAGRVDMALSEASGPLVVFSGGVRRDGSWERGLPHEPTAWRDDQGEPLVIPPGPVWIEVVPLSAYAGG